MRPLSSRTAACVSRVCAVVLAVAGIGVLGTATANASSGGGCMSKPHIEACISASGSHLEPDLYVLNNSGCTSVDIGVIDVSKSIEVFDDASVTNGCALGLHGPWPLDSSHFIVTNGDTYEADVQMDFANGTFESVLSRQEVLNY